MAASDTNRVRLASVEETTLGTTPGTPRMRIARMTGEGLQYQPAFTQSDEIRSDRMNADPIKTNESNGGTINGELSYPVDESPFSSWLKSLFFNDWANTPSFDNDGTADSVITDAGTAADTYAVTSGGAAVKAGHLVRATGFTNSANNQIFAAVAGTSTTVKGSSLSLTAETAPPGTARLKVVGFAGASGDIAATSTGLSSTSLDFTTLGLAVGQWLKIGGSAAGEKFATATDNGWARISGTITAHAIPLDNLPAGWAADAGTSKTIRVWFGDRIINGTTMVSQTIERGFLAQETPTYIVQRGMVAGQGEFTFEAEQKATYTLTWTGMTGEVTTTALDADPDAATTNRVMSASVNVGRIAENGAAVASPNFARSLKLTVNNNLRGLSAIRSDGEVGPVDIGSGSCDVTVEMETYFGSDALLSKLFDGTVTNINTRIAIDSQALVFSVPRVTFTGGNVSAGGKNQDAMLPLTGMAALDSDTNCHISLDRFEYVE